MSVFNSKIDVLSSNFFNSNIEESKLVPWKFLSDEKRLELFDIYINSNFNENIDEKTILLLRKKILSGKLKLKKEITYDKVNKRIVKINFLSFNKDSNKYIYSPDIKNKNNLKKKSAHKILFSK